MRKVTVGLVSLTLATGLGAGLTAPAVAAPKTGSSPVGGAKIDRGAVSDELPNPAEAKRRELRQEALTRLLDGKGTVQKRGASTVMKVGEAPDPTVGGNATAAASAGEDQYVELAREKTDKIFVVLAEFGDTRHSAYCDSTDESACDFPSDGTIIT